MELVLSQDDEYVEGVSCRSADGERAGGDVGGRICWPNASKICHSDGGLHSPLFPCGAVGVGAAR